MGFSISLKVIWTAVIVAAVIAIGGVDNIARAQSAPLSPTDISVVNGSDLGEARLSWDEVTGATYYRVGWMADEDYRQALSEPNGEWRKELRYSNIVNQG